MHRGWSFSLIGASSPKKLQFAMATLVFDIETAALPIENFDEAQQEYLFREANRISDPLAQHARKAELEQQLNLYPFTARIICIAMINADSQRGQVLYIAEDCGDEQTEPAPIKFIPCVDEAELLAAFWEVATRYDSVVTFNGRGFDVPFIYLRSALLNIPITRKDWLGYRYQTEPHCDLAEQFTFYSVSGRDGAAKRFNLDFYCKAFGVDSPKSHGVTGLDVNRLLAAGEHRSIAEYCLRDVEATVLLYKVWKERLFGIR
jgi:3'-5' exonuclease